MYLLLSQLFEIIGSEGTVKKTPPAKIRLVDGFERLVLK